LEEPRALHLPELWPYLHRRTGVDRSRLQVEVQDLWPRDRGAPCRSAASPGHGDPGRPRGFAAAFSPETERDGRSSPARRAGGGRTRAAATRAATAACSGRSCSGRGGSGSGGCSCCSCSRGCSGGGARAARTEGLRTPRGNRPARRARSPETAVSPDAEPEVAPPHVRAERDPRGPRRRLPLHEPGPGREACPAPGGNPCPGCPSPGGVYSAPAAGARSRACPAKGWPVDGSSRPSRHRGGAPSVARATLPGSARYVSLRIPTSSTATVARLRNTAMTMARPIAASAAATAMTKKAMA
jgi:hypothetical protein